MDWYQVLALVGGNVALILPLWLWNRAEARADARHMDIKLESNRELVHAIHNEMKEFYHAIHDEMKDFHYRLLEIERSKK